MVRFVGLLATMGRSGRRLRECGRMVEWVGALVYGVHDGSLGGE